MQLSQRLHSLWCRAKVHTATPLVSPVDSWLRAGEQVPHALPSGITGHAAKPLKGEYLYTRPHFIMVIEKPSIENPGRCQTVSQGWCKRCWEDSTGTLVNWNIGPIFHATASLKLAKWLAADTCSSGSLTPFYPMLDKYNLLLINFAGWGLSQLHPVPVRTNPSCYIQKQMWGLCRP